VAEKAQLNKQLDDLITRIEAREAELLEIENIEKEKAAREAIDLARDMIDAIDLKDLSMENYKDYIDPINAAKAQLMKARAAAAGFPEFAEDLKGLQEALDEKENKVEVYETGSKEKERIEKEYKLKTEEELKEKDDEIKKTVDTYKKKLEDLAKETPDPEKLIVDQTELAPPNPESFEAIQQGMISHRTESLKMLEEVNFLQTCGQDLATRVAEFEEKKSELSFANVGRFALSSALIIPGAIGDIGLRIGDWIGWNPKKKRMGDYMAGMFGVDSRVEEIQEKKTTFETEFAKKQTELAEKKTRLDTYGNVLQTNSENLKTNEPKKVQEDVKKNIEAQLTAEGLIPTAEPWKGIIAELVTEFETKAVEMVGPAVYQLDEQVDGSVSEIENATGVYLQAANDTAEYIQTLDVHSATVLDMSVGFLTKNVAKGLDGIGDVLATNPITGVVGGLFRAAGGLVEGVGTLITDPDKVVTGLGNLVGIGPTGCASAAWKGLATGFFGVEAFKTGWAKVQEGGVMNAIHGWGEIAAGIGEAGGNVVATILTGGGTAAGRTAGLLGKMAGGVGTGVTTTLSNMGRVGTKITTAGKWIGTKSLKAGTHLAKGGNLALTPLKWGLKPLKLLGNKGKAVETYLKNSVLDPRTWTKARLDKAILQTGRTVTKTEKISRGIGAGVLPFSYTAVGMEKNKNRELKDGVSEQFKKDDFEPTLLADIGKAPVAAAAANGATTPPAGPQQTVEYAPAIKQEFEHTMKIKQLEAFFHSGINSIDQESIKDMILEYSTSDVAVTVNGIKGKTLNDVWALRKTGGETVAFTLDSKMGLNGEPLLTKIEVRTT